MIKLSRTLEAGHSVLTPSTDFDWGAITSTDERNLILDEDVNNGSEGGKRVEAVRGRRVRVKGEMEKLNPALKYALIHLFFKLGFLFWWTKCWTWKEDHLNNPRGRFWLPTLWSFFYSFRSFFFLFFLLFFVFFFFFYSFFL